MTPEDEEFEALEMRLKAKTTQPSQGWRKRQIEALKPREWVGLTDEEREELMDTYDVASTDYAQAIEAKLKEKNT